MSDQFSLSHLFNQAVPNLRDYYQHEADRTAQVPAVLDVPVRVVPPPVTIKGSLSFIATFPSDLIYGKKYEDVLGMIMEAFSTAGLEPNPLLPELRIHNLQAWREEVEQRRPEPIGRVDQREVERETSRGDALAGNALAGLREDGPGGVQKHSADPGERITDGPGDG